MAKGLVFYETPADAKAGGNQIDPTVLFWGGGAVLFVFLVSSFIAGYLAPDSIIAVSTKDFLGMVESGSFDQPRSAMIIIAYVSCGLFTFIFYLYLGAFVEILWNRFFVQANDKYLLQIWFILHTLCLVAILFFPTWWWWSMVAAFAYSWTILFARFRGYRNSHGHAARSGAVAPWRHTQLALITAIFRNYSVKVPLLAGPFIFLLWVSQASRGSFPISGQMLYAGMFVAASGLFVVSTVLSLLLRVFSGLPTILERAEKHDIEYFTALIR